MRVWLNSAAVAFNIGMFLYLMMAGALLILSRWYTVAELLPWNLLFGQLAERFLRELQHFPSFLALMVLPSCVFAAWRLRELAKS